jgi:hypothetical protein
LQILLNPKKFELRTTPTHKIKYNSTYQYKRKYAAT